jgi:TonB-linked SusC/RagA family outer membrane protein
MRKLKRTVGFLLLFVLLGSAATAQTITFKGKDVPLTKIFSIIREQTGYLVVYNADQLAYAAKPVSVSAKSRPLEQFLKDVMKGQTLEFSIENKTIVISLKMEKAKAIKTSESVEMTAMTPGFHAEIRGFVRDSLSHPLSGASVMLYGTGQGTQTNEAGFFILETTSEEQVRLEISYAGYETRIVKADYHQNVDVILRSSPDPLDATIVQAYGTTSRRYSVGSISTVSAADIQKQPVTNVLLALEGQAPGLTVTPTSGAPGAAVQLQIRGQNSLSASPNGILPFDQPLFIIDGVPFAPQNQGINLLSSVGSATNYNNPYGGMSPFNSINPADIESISLLKDADATSIYGTQGANGVVIITTKKGQAGKTNFDLDVNTGPNKVTRQVQMMNTPQYLALRREAVQNDGITLSPADNTTFPDLLLFDSTRYTNWFKKFFGGTANNTNVHASLSGGSANSTFIVSAGYTHATYNFPGDFAETRYSLHSGFHHNSIDHRLTVDLGTDYSYDQNFSTALPQVSTALLLAPNTPDMVDAAGNLVWTYKDVFLNGTSLYGDLRQPNRLETYNLTNSLRLAYQFVKGLTLSVNGGYSRLTTQEYSASPRSAQSPQYSPIAQATFANNNYQTINIEPQLDLKKAIGKGNLSVLLGGTYKKNLNSNDIINGYGYQNDNLLGSVAGASSLYASNASTVYKYDAAFGRIGYIYDHKYIVSLTGRRDGSSNFGPGRQFGAFGSAGAGWIFTEENSIKKTLSFLSYGKLSANYGTSGSDATAPYQYQAFWQPVQNIAPFQGLAPYQPVNLYNPNYSWDTKKAWNASLDLGFLKDRLLLNATWYRSRTGNQLTGYQLPTQTGFTSVTENFNAVVQNMGWEFTVSSTNIRTKTFNWSTRFNLTINRNKLIAFPGLASSPYASIYEIGKSTFTANGYRYKGVNDTTGIFQFYTAKGAPTYSPNYQTTGLGGDWGPIADLQPKFFGGLSNTFSYKGFGLSVLLQFSKQTAYNYLYSVYSYAIPGTAYNVPVEAQNRWRQPGDHAEFQRATSGYGSKAYTSTSTFLNSSGVYSDDSYVRLKNLAFSYDLPQSALKKLSMKGARVYVNAQNLLTLTDYKVGDPEMPGRLYNIPMQRTIAGGLSLNF